MLREVFHLEFLRWMTRKFQAGQYAVKGGVNLRLFFKSFRYSEDMDIDLAGVRVERVKKTVMEILGSRGFLDNLRPFGIEGVVPPDLEKAKQTETTQRFKIHLLTRAGEDLFTKVEFSRRGFKGNTVVESVSSEILRAYKMGPLFVSHYDVSSAIIQKVKALAERPALQARDIFDLFILSTQYGGEGAGVLEISPAAYKKAQENIFLVEFPQFRDAVVAYLGPEEQKTYSSAGVWDEIKLKTSAFLQSVGRTGRDS